MVLDCQFHIEDAENLAEDGMSPYGPNARVSQSFDVEGVDYEEVELDEGHLGADCCGEEGDDKDFEALLNVVGKDG